MSRRQYPFHLIEPKWQAKWNTEQTFKAWNPGETIPEGHPFGVRHALGGQAPEASQLPPKFYILDMFPYPSGAGLHVGHPEGYTATDILSRFRRAQGYNVLHPMGWDAFGLPAEQYAIKTGQHPRITTNQNIATFKRQINSLGFSYDWSREVDTTDTGYFRWTQWIFLQLYNSWVNPATGKAENISTLEYSAECDSEELKRNFRDEHRLAFLANVPVWWSPDLGTVLANEEVEDGKSKIGGFPVVRKPMWQWMLRITAYADRLLNDLDTIEWTNSLKKQQQDWIGRSEGAEVEFAVVGRTDSLRVFTTRPDTLFGATYMVLAPEHKLVPEITTDTQRQAVEDYRVTVGRKSDRERTEIAKEKTGVFTGAYAINPVTGQPIPIWIADYVLATYGTGAIMAVPAHDTRDFEFAQAFNLPIVQVVAPPDVNIPWQGFTEEGTSVNSQSAVLDLNGLRTPDAKRKIIDWLESTGVGKPTINYKLRDWLFSRQRYWGEPFPIIWKQDANGNSYHESLPELELPLVPPPLAEYKPTASGEPPLARAHEWVNLPDGSKREVNTMPQWAGSCWYYLRYLDAQNTKRFVDSKAESYWMGTTGGSTTTTPGVDLYIGGAEHAVLHLLYARFWHKFLFDLGQVSTAEPFYRLVNQGLILGEDGQKMSKSRGNVVNPDDVLVEFGADALRLYEMFMGPLQDTKPWNTSGVEGVYRFLGRVWRLFVDEASETEYEQSCTTLAPERHASLLASTIRLHPSIQDVTPDKAQLKSLHACIKKVTEDLEALRFNTAISAMMVFVKDAIEWKQRPASAMGTFLQLLAPFAPHVAEELWEKLHGGLGKAVPSLSYQAWPAFDASHLVEDVIEVPVQVNGKLRDVISVATAATNQEVEAAALASEKVQSFMVGKTVKKVVVVPPKKLVNIVIG